MKALMATTYDGPKALRYTELADPEVSENDVMIQVVYSGVGLVDLLFLRGFAQLPLPLVPGLEVSGIVKEVGSQVTKFKPGDRVAGLTITGLNGFANRVVLKENYVVKLPDNLDLSLAAGILTNAATALVLLKEIAPLRAGQSVLVYGATGGLGLQVGQVAQVLGAEQVTAVVSSQEKKEKALPYYDKVYLKDDFLHHNTEKFDLIVDPIGGVQRKQNLSRLHNFGTLAIVGNASQEEHANIDPDFLWLNNLTISGFNFGMYAGRHYDTVNAYLNWAIQLASHKQLSLPDLHEVSAEDSITKLLAFEKGQIDGKLLIHHP